MLREAIGRIARHSAVYGAAEQVGRLASFLLIPLHTRYLPEQDYGTNALLGTSIAIFSQLAGINIHSAMTRLYLERNEERERAAVVSTTLWCAAASSAFIALLLFALQPLALRLIPSADPALPDLFRLTLGIFVFQMVKEVLLKYLQARQQSLLYAGISLAKLGAEIALQVYFLAVLGLGVKSIFLAMLIGEAATVVVLLAALLPRMGLAFSRPIFLALAAFTLPLILNGLLQWCLHQANRFLLGFLRDTAEVGVFELAHKLGQIPNYLVMGPFLLIWYPYVFAVGEPERQRELCAKLTPFFMLVMSAAVLGVSLLANDLVGVAGQREGYRQAWAAVPLLAAGTWFWALFQVVQTGFYVQKATGKLPLLTGAAAVCSVLLNLALIPRYGFLGAAVATTLTFALLTVLTARTVRPLFPVDWPWKRVFGPAFAGLLVYGASLLLPMKLGWTSVVARLALWMMWAAWTWFFAVRAWVGRR